MRFPHWGLEAVGFKLYLQLIVFKPCAIIPLPIPQPKPAGGWGDVRAELDRLCPPPTGSHDRAICLTGERWGQSISVVPFTD